MRATSNKIMDDGPEEIEALLPWYAAGTLDAHDARRVEDALKHDAALQKQYAVIREEFAETVALNEELGAPSSRALQKLMVAIDAEPARAASPAASQGLGRFARFFASLSPRTVAWSASFGALAQRDTVKRGGCAVVTSAVPSPPVVPDAADRPNAIDVLPLSGREAGLDVATMQKRYPLLRNAL